MFGPLINRFLVDIRRVWTSAMASASVVTTTQETWDFSAADTILDVAIDGGVVQNIPILRSGFADDSAATDAEVVAQINAAIVGGGSYATIQNEVVIESDTTESTSRIEVSGGTANAILLFPVAEEVQAGYNSLLGGVRAYDDGTQRGVEGRREHATVTVRCQLDRANWGEQQMTSAGVHEMTSSILTLDMKELRRTGLVKADGSPRFQIGDRIEQIRETDGTSVESFTETQKVHVVNVERAGHGLSLFRARPNLVYLHCAKDRVRS